MKKTYYWTANCAMCNQGRLILQNDITNHRIYAHCEECEYGWLEPEELNDLDKGFLTLAGDYQTADPSWEEIQQSQWRDHVAGSFEEED